MKQHKIAFIIALITTVISLIVYFISVFVEFCPSVIFKDISLAVLSSALFIIVTSLIGYFIERDRCFRDIINSLRTAQSGNYINDYTLEDGKAVYSIQQTIAILKNSMDAERALYQHLKEYESSRFFKFKDVLLNDIFDKSKDYTKKLFLWLRNIHDVNFNEHFCLKQYNEINFEYTQKVIDWLKSKKYDVKTLAESYLTKKQNND